MANADDEVRRMTSGVTSWIRLGWWDRVKVLFGACIVLSATQEGMEAPKLTVGSVVFLRRRIAA